MWKDGAKRHQETPKAASDVCNGDLTLVGNLSILQLIHRERLGATRKQLRPILQIRRSGTRGI